MDSKGNGAHNRHSQEVSPESGNQRSERGTGEGVGIGTPGASRLWGVIGHFLSTNVRYLQSVFVRERRIRETLA